MREGLWCKLTSGFAGCSGRSLLLSTPQLLRQLTSHAIEQNYKYTITNTQIQVLHNYCANQQVIPIKHTVVPNCFFTSCLVGARTDFPGAVLEGRKGLWMPCVRPKISVSMTKYKYSPCHAVLQFLESCEAPRMSKRGFLHWKLTKRSSYEALWSLKAFYQFSSHDSFRAPVLASVYTTGFKGNYKTRQKSCEVSSAVVPESIYVSSSHDSSYCWVIFFTSHYNDFNGKW